MLVYQKEVFNQVANFFDDEEYDLCTGESALKTMFAMKNVQRNDLYNL